MADKLGIENYRILVPSADPETGLGVIGTLPKPMNYADFIGHIRDVLECSYVRYTDLPSLQGEEGGRLIQRVALCGGSGAEFISEAIAQGADVYITADCKYHEFQDADGRIGLIDVDHWYSERHACEIFKDILDSIGIKCVISTADKSPINILKY